MRSESPVLSLKQAADYLQVSKAHLSNVINGKISGVPPVRSFRVGRRVLIKREWIDEWLETANHEVARSAKIQSMPSISAFDAGKRIRNASKAFSKG